MNSRDLAFMARLGFVARRAGYRVVTRWRNDVNMQYRLTDVTYGHPVTRWMSLDELCEKIRLIQDFNRGIERLGEK